jgi:hypothetical protein
MAIVREEDIRELASAIGLAEAHHLLLLRKAGGEFDEIDLSLVDPEEFMESVKMVVLAANRVVAELKGDPDGEIEIIPIS